jgi:hypothetical protein
LNFGALTKIKKIVHIKCSKLVSFGLKNTLAKFQRTTNQVFTSLDYAKFYIDDIILFGSIMEEHCHHLQNVFKCLVAHGLKLHPRKCKLSIPHGIFGPHDLPMRFRGLEN